MSDRAKKVEKFVLIVVGSLLVVFLCFVLVWLFATQSKPTHIGMPSKHDAIPTSIIVGTTTNVTQDIPKVIAITTGEDYFEELVGDK